MKAVEIKICGIKNRETVEVLNELPINYAGFIFAKSSRQVSFGEAKTLIENLDPRITPVGVFVNATNKELEEGLKSGIRILQLHGNESPERVQEITAYLKGKGYGFKVWKALPIKDVESLKAMEGYGALEAMEGILCDTYEKGNYGGTGEKFNWDILQGISLDAPLILAGGLNEDNVLDGISLLAPDVVDINSGVETGGEKDASKIKRIVKKIRGREDA